ncbi:iron-sulfur cluster assembly scaffold protein [Candidatus Pelagibacter sp.]|nr:iron-sulfur cluster assembly scaffold protein [Candidatus Pelagibacter sp.]
MDLRILKIASHTENNKILENFTHKSKNKNPLCGDEMEISLIIENNIVKDIGYQCKSCIYCQASVSLLSRSVIKEPLDKITGILEKIESFFDKDFNFLKEIKLKNVKNLKEIMTTNNISRKECLLLPFKTLSKALNL